LRTGDGVHVLTGPIFVEGAEPGDLLKVTIQDLQPRVNPEGKTYGSNANAWWGFQARVPQADGSSFDAGDFTDTPGSNDETVTIYEFMTDSTGSYAVPSYSFEWPTITDPDGVERNYIAYPGTCVPHDVHGATTPTSEVADMGWAKAAAITYHDDLAPVKIPVFYPASFCTPSTRRRRGRGAIAGQHARRVHGPRAGVARRRRLDPADAERRQPRRQAYWCWYDDVLPRRGRRRAFVHGRRAHGAGRLGARRSAARRPLFNFEAFAGC